MNPKKTLPLPTDYQAFLEDLKKRIRSAQVRAGLAASRELILLYWDLGKAIHEQQNKKGWGSSTIERLSQDLQNAFPGIQGFSPRNIWRMRAFYRAYTGDIESLPQPVAELDGKNLPQAVAEIPWGHNVVLMEKVKDPVERLWYIQKTIENGWSRNILIHQIEANLFRRQGKALTNFEQALPAPQSDLAQQILKDPYVFDFLTLEEEARERDLENALLDNIREFLLELGVGFALVGSQYPLQVGVEDYYIDLLFYHLKLRAYVVIELKMTDFKPEYAGKMNFYLSAVDDLLRSEHDNPSIGMILCKSRDKLTVEYALRDLRKPIGVSRYEVRLVKSLPKQLKGQLPTIEQLETELEK